MQSEGSPLTGVKGVVLTTRVWMTRGPTTSGAESGKLSLSHRGSSLMPGVQLEVFLQWRPKSSGSRTTRTGVRRGCYTGFLIPVPSHP